MTGNRSALTITLGVLGSACLLGLVSVLTNINPVEQMSGEADGWKTVRLAFSLLLNSGTVWAGFPILLGWWVNDIRASWLVGLVGTHLALVSHYAIGRWIGIFEPEIWVQNTSWFILATVVGPTLGFAGAMIHRRDVLGLITSMLIPFGAFAEPFVVGMFTPHPFLPNPIRCSSALVGVILVVFGINSCAWALRRRRRMSDSHLHGVRGSGATAVI